MRGAGSSRRYRGTFRLAIRVYVAFAANLHERERERIEQEERVPGFGESRGRGGLSSALSSLLSSLILR